VRIERTGTFDEVRRAALALAREVERRAPGLATSKWWKEERHGVFIDYNQNAKDRTIASAYSVRPTSDARVSAPLTWDEIDACEPGDFTLASMPARFAAVGDRHAAIDSHPCSLARVVELSAQQERDGAGDAPWPPHYRKQPGEPSRVQPSRRRTPTSLRPGDAGPPRLQRRLKHPLVEIGRARKKEEALAGLERWKTRHSEAAAHLEPADVLVDAMRGRFHTWTRIRVNLQHVPPALRPAQEALDPDQRPDDWSGVSARGSTRRKPSRARTES
jgi:bifunctional non-homologous end joining protein LigD